MSFKYKFNFKEGDGFSDSNKIKPAKAYERCKKCREKFKTPEELNKHKDFCGLIQMDLLKNIDIQINEKPKEPENVNNDLKLDPAKPVLKSSLKSNSTKPIKIILQNKCFNLDSSEQIVNEQNFVNPEKNFKTVRWADNV